MIKILKKFFIKFLDKMNFIDKKNCFEQFFLIFLLIFISIPLQVHYESFDLFYFFGIVNYFKLLILVFLFSILFYLIFFKFNKKINFLLKLILVALIFLGIFFLYLDILIFI